MSHQGPLYNYTSYIPQDESIKFDKLPVTKSNSRIVIGEYFPLPFDEISRVRIAKYLELSWSIQDIFSRNTELSDDERIHIVYLILSLKAYFSCKIYVMKRVDLIPLIMREEGLKTLKRIRLKSFLISNHGTFVERPEWYDSVPSYQIYDIGEIFNYNYGMFWESEDTQDYLLSTTPVNTDSEIVRLFKSVTERIISSCDDFEQIRPLEVLLRVSNSKALDNNESIPYYLGKSSNLYFSDKRSEGRRVLITTGPGQGRDAIINKIYDLNSIQIINENIRNCLKKNFREFLLIGTSDECKKQFFRRCKKSQSFLCRDIKKEGLTKPKYLCNIILSALNKRFPECFAFTKTNFYSGPWYEGDKSERGHGLGMANELTTLLQILIFYTVNEYLGIEGEYISASSAYYLNDDAVVFINGDPDQLEIYVDADFTICDGLGIMAQRDKSFFSQDCAVFCEMYFSRGKPFVNDKESYILRESNIISKCSNILEAKFYAGNMKGSLSDIENILKKNFIFLGYEFSKDEINWPISLGGLRPFKLRGTDFTLNYVSQYQDLRTLWKAYNANLECKLWRWNKNLKNYIPPVVKLFPQVLTEKDERILDKMTITSIYNLSSLFFRPTKEHKFFSSVRKLYKKRQKIFNNTTTFPTFEIFCEEYSTRSNNNVALPSEFIDRMIKVKLFINKNFKDPYLITNPMSAYLNKFEFLDKETPPTAWGLFQSTTVVSAEKSVFTRSRTMNTLSLIDRFEEDVDISILVFPENEEDIPDFMESYPKPFLTYELVKNGNMLPIPKQKFRNRDLLLRKEVFGKYLNFREISLSQTRTWKMMMIILAFEKYFKGFHEFEDDFWDAVDQQLKKVNQPPVELDNSDSSEDFCPDGEPIHIGYDQVEVQEEKVPEDAIPSAIQSEVESESESIQENIEEEDPKIRNPFLRHNPLPEGDLSVYGSEEWIRWLVHQDVWDIEKYTDVDKDLEYACIDVVAFLKKFVMSNLFDELNNNLKRNVIESIDQSWVAYFYKLEHFDKKTEEEDPIEISLFED